MLLPPETGRRSEKPGDSPDEEDGIMRKNSEGVPFCYHRKPARRSEKPRDSPDGQDGIDRKNSEGVPFPSPGLAAQRATLGYRHP